ncbi:segregation/condensation protein A [Streptomyces sp. SR27]|uniref:segregation and condensation protein A n=1 Tax=Streptomyces sp. SR27 TaxID=3076630 RepID=UPI00295A9E16|nr:segregation/condensation protein A [Streptomyces sp. SR27]MDV9191597.1 segregation/condensation protein A [Streptomyces sp. SR27]
MGRSTGLAGRAGAAADTPRTAVTTRDTAAPEQPAGRARDTRDETGVPARTPARTPAQYLRAVRPAADPAQGHRAHGQADSTPDPYRAVLDRVDASLEEVFLVVAATLLDLKAARLLPAAEVEDEADLALLEARDLLFARLLQYRAYKKIAAIFAERWEAEGRRHPRTVGLEPHHAELLPEVVISIGAEGFAKLAVKAMRPRAEPQVYVDHIHAPLVSVREQAAVVVALLRERGTALFRELIEDVGDETLTVVARFLALLELYREKAVALDQETALGDLTVSWTGGEADPAGSVTDEFDQEAPA